MPSVECVLLRKLADVVLHDEVVVAGGIVRLRQVVEVCHFVVVVTRDVDDGLLLSLRMEGCAEGVVHEVADALPVSLGNGYVARVVATQHDEVDVLLFAHLVDGIENGAAQAHIVEVRAADKSELVVQVGEAAYGHDGFVLGSQSLSANSCQTCKEQQNGEKKALVDFFHNSIALVKHVYLKNSTLPAGLRVGCF